MQNTQKKILVTGALGFIGAAICRKLSNSGADLYALYRVNSNNKPRLANVNYIQADLSDKQQISKVMAEIKPDICVHCAWLSDKVSYWQDEKNNNWIEYSNDLFKAFAESGGKKFIGLGSCAEYVWREQPLKEEDDIDKPDSLYGKAKLELANSLLDLSNQFGIPVVWARIFFCFGPGEADSRLVPSVIKSLLTGKPALCSDGLQRRDYMYLEDIARSIELLIRLNYQGKINIASGKAVELKSIVKYIAGKLNAKNLLCMGALPRRDNDALTVVANTEKLSALGFRPAFSLEQGLDITIENIANQIQHCSR